MARPNKHNGAAFDALIGAFYDTAIAPIERCAWSRCRYSVTAIMETCTSRTVTATYPQKDRFSRP